MYTPRGLMGVLGGLFLEKKPIFGWKSVTPIFVHEPGLVYKAVICLVKPSLRSRHWLIAV